MNKSALKTFATSARNELLKKVEAKAMKIGITEDNIKKADIESSDAIFIDGRQLSKEEKIQRDKLIARINQNGFKQVIEEVAYIWFNRFTALRFMEVNDYLPAGVRVLSSSNPNSAEPDMINEALELDLEIELDKEYIYNLKLSNETEELFKYLIIKHCNDLNKYLPFMFEKIDDYTEILFPEGLLAKDSFIRKMTDIEFILEDNWNKVEVIGWLYQYYIAEEKDRVIKAKKKYKTEEIPFATQLFTPDWIVRYMVQNSLGRYWVESHPEHRDLLENWEFYLENPNNESDFEEKLAPYINKELKVEDIKCFDPAMGSGHILVYMFDVLYEIYSKCGYMEREIPRLIIENNLYGLDIDDRAYQLACFSVVMKALDYNSRFFRSIEREGLKLNLASIQEANILDNEEAIAYIAGERNGEKFDMTKEFVSQFNDAKNIGSLIKAKEYDRDFFQKRFSFIKESPANDLFEEDIRNKVLELLPYLLKQTQIMVLQYDILVTNPPYMGTNYMPAELTNYLKGNYPQTKSDTFSAFMKLCFNKVYANGHLGLVTPYVWMFITTYESLRRDIVSNRSISSLIQLEYNAFPDVTVPICTFTLRNNESNVAGEYVKLSDFTGVQNQPIKTLEAINNPNVDYRFTSYTKEFERIPGSPIAFWASEQMRRVFEEESSLEEVASPKQGMATCDNKRFLRFWFEVSNKKIKFNAKNSQEAIDSKLKWFPYHKGGTFRKWSGNFDYVVNWENNGAEVKEFTSMLSKDKPGGRIKNEEYYFRKGLTWSALSSGNISFRYFNEGFLFDTKGSVCFPKDENTIYYLAGLLNSKVVSSQMKILAPTLDYNPQSLRRVPYIGGNELNPTINELVREAIAISKNEWDSYETSWDFEVHPILKFRKDTSKIKVCIENWEKDVNEKFNRLRSIEEDLNKIYIGIYGLEDDFTPEVNESEVTIRKIDSEQAIKSFMSYSIGCIFGRYSLDEEGLVYAGGDFGHNPCDTFPADKDNIVPILDGAYFEDDILSKFIEFVNVVFGEETLTKNIDFIAETLGKKKGETSKEAIRRYFLNDFFKAHVQTYKKRPIYWLFTSGKQKAFNCLIYIHRYDKTTLSRIRTDYLHEYQIRLDAEKKGLLSIIEGDYSKNEINNAKKTLRTLDKKIEEIKDYDELLHHMADMQIDIDLDNGVVGNYEKLKGLVSKI